MELDVDDIIEGDSGAVAAPAEAPKAPSPPLASPARAARDVSQAAADAPTMAMERPRPAMAEVRAVPSTSGPQPRTPAVAPAPARLDWKPPVPPQAQSGKQAAAELLAECESALKGVSDPLRRVRLHYEAARLLESALDDPRRAGEYYLKALEHLGSHLPTLRGARRALIQQKKLKQALDLFDEEARLLADPSKKALVFYEKGVMLEDGLGQKKEAREAFKTALELDPSNLSVLKAVARSQEQASDWEALDRTLQETAQRLERDPRHRAQVLADRARLVETRRGDVSRAVELYKEAFGVDATAAGALDSLKQLLHEQGRHGELVEVLEREVGLLSDPQSRALVLGRIATLHVERLGDVAAGIKALERGREESPEDLRLLNELAVLYERAGDWPNLVKVLAEIVGKTADPSLRLAHLHRMAVVAEEKLKDTTRATGFYEEALQLDAAFLPSIQALTKLYRTEGNWQSLVAVLLGQAERAKDPLKRAQAYTSVADIFEHHLKSAEQAAQQHAHALGVVPGYEPAFKALVRLYSAMNRHRELIELYERMVELGDESALQIAYLFKIGRLYEDTLGEPGNALEVYRRILKIDGHNLGAIQACSRAAERAGRFPELVQALEAEAEQRAAGQQRLALLQRAAEVTEKDLGDDVSALAKYRRVLQQDPKHSSTLVSLGGLLYRLGHWDDLLRVYLTQLEAVSEGRARAQLLVKMAEITDEKLGDEGRTLQYLRDAVSADPTNRGAIDRLATTLREKGRHAELVELWRSELTGVKDASRKAALWLCVAQALEDQLGQKQQALAAYRDAVKAQPGFAAAEDGVRRLLSELGHSAELLETLAEETLDVNDPAQHVSKLIQQAQLQRDRLAKLDAAKALYQSVLAKDPGHLGALLALEAISSSAGDDKSLVQVLAAQARVLKEPQARVAVLRELARRQDDEGAKKAALFSVLELAPTDAVALGELEDLALRAGDAELLSHVDAQLGAATQDASLAAAHHTRLAEMLERRGDASALDLFRAACSRDPDNFAAIRGFSRLAQQRSDPELLEEAAEREARMALDPSRSARLLVQSAEQRVAQGGDVQGAAKSLSRALELQPDDPVAAAKLCELLLASGQLATLLGALSQTAQKAQTKERRAALWTRVGELYAEHQHDLPAAIAALNRATAEASQDLSALATLAELYARDHQWGEARDCYKKLLVLTPESERGAINLKLAEILDEHLADPAGARRAVDSVLTREPGNQAALSRLLGLQLAQGEQEAARATADRLVSSSKDDAARAQALTTLGQLEQRSGKPERALEAYEQAIRVMGAGSEAAAHLKTLLVNSKFGKEGWQRLADALTHFVEKSRLSAVELAPTYRELGNLLDHTLRRPEDALRMLDRGLAVSPQDLGLRAQVAGLLLRTGNHERALGELRLLLDKSPQDAELWRQLAQALDGLGRHPEATLTLGVLVALGAASEVERTSWASRPIRAAQAEAGSLDARELGSIDALGGPDTRCDLIATLSDGLGKVHPPELERYGLSSKDKLAPRSGDFLRGVAERVAAVFGVGEFDLYVHEAHAGLAEVELTDPISILVPSYVTGLTESQQVFVLARLMANIPRRLSVVDKLPPRAVEVLLAAAARSVDSSFGSGLMDEDQLASYAKRVYKSVSWLGRGRMEEAASLYLGAAPMDILEWARKVRLTAARAALVVCDDLPGAIDVLRRTEGDLAGVQGKALEEGNRLIQELLRYWVSDSAFALRRRIAL